MLVVAALGVTWIFDGLEVTIVGSGRAAGAAERDTLGLSADDIGLAPRLTSPAPSSAC